MVSFFIVPTIDIFFLLLGGTFTVTVDDADFEIAAEEDSPTVVEIANSVPDSNTPLNINLADSFRPFVV